MKFFKKLLFVLFLGIFASGIAQTKKRKPIKGSLNSGTIESQFDYLYRKSYTYKSVKSVKIADILKIKGNVLDSLQSAYKKINETNSTIESQKKEINSLKENLKNTNDKLIDITKEKDSMSLLGIQMSKVSYNTLMWSLIFGLLAFLLFFIFRFKSSNILTKQAQKLLNETEEEFENYKRVAIEREQKVRRELQDEINKHKYGKKESKKK
ncbi:MAG: tRNA (guanine-N1)-methyltransferase [Flavobacteriia bacterium]|nr:MAG: tRNA (guanine-N1)-methyltransferase [Flavobacteriia bacterium]